MQIDVVTLFPDYFPGALACGPVRAAQEKQSLGIRFVNPRDFTNDLHRTVDDSPYGGGAGMVLKPEPLFQAVESVRDDNAGVILLSPQGRLFTQAVALELSRRPHIVLICGRYKDVDGRVRVGLVDDEISIGDFVLAGGEAAALVIIESIARLLPGAVEHEESVTTDSFSSSLLGTPHYTRPRSYRGMDVPEVLLSGDHARVDEWRRKQALLVTARRRPELLRDEVLTEDERRFLLAELGDAGRSGKELPDDQEPGS